MTQKKVTAIPATATEEGLGSSGPCVEFVTNKWQASANEGQMPRPQVMQQKRDMLQKTAKDTRSTCSSLPALPPHSISQT